MIFIWFLVVPEIQFKTQASQNMNPAASVRIYSQTLRGFPPRPRHPIILATAPYIAIPTEIKKNPLFLRTTACRTDSELRFLVWPWKLRQASSRLLRFRHIPPVQGPWCSGLEAKSQWHSWSLHQTLWKLNIGTTCTIFLIRLAVSLNLPRLPEWVWPLVSLKGHSSRSLRAETSETRFSIITLVWKTMVVQQGTQCETWLASFLHKQNKSLLSQSRLYLTKTFVSLGVSLNLLEPFPEWGNRHCKWTMTQKPPCTRKYPTHSKGTFLT